ncbi:DUF928 domain-containing protein [Coleofasciculus sp. C1-SOL-03]|uniref:DUF928 domain-containing protein n=1 Tax=Coleofasciculus sp. C1-SOL-03 TaxID=3069522 RepID=UPI004063CA14
MPVSLLRAEFILEDSQGNMIYQTPVKLPKNPSVISVTLPATSTTNELQNTTSKSNDISRVSAP